ncbi:MAG: indole-3-glycerol phosphate synthase TrpC [Gemmatimonadota bacterium]
MAPTHLDRIVAGVREELEARRSAAPFGVVAARARANAVRRDLGARRGGEPGIIAEIKRASPSRGWIRRELDAAATARTYANAGACAVSVLTEGRRFGGSLADLEAASRACGAVPVLRKDFVLDEYMLAESRAFGADLVLLMVAVLGDATAEMVALARVHGLEPLVEVHDEGQMEIAAASGAAVIGINNRDLATLRVDLCVSERLLPKAPRGAVKVVESGIARRDDVVRLAALGADAFLVGEALAGAADPGEAVRRLRGDDEAPQRVKERA